MVGHGHGLCGEAHYDNEIHILYCVCLRAELLLELVHDGCILVEIQNFSLSSKTG